tara:strand:+ start:3598 stop:6000 length:2403 start_codon:yes stop_codon:yes gene_type:complete
MHRIVSAASLLVLGSLATANEPSTSAVLEAGPVRVGFQQDAQGRIPVKLIHDRLVVSCDLSTRFRRIPANLFVEYEGPFALQLHNKAADGLKCVSPDGTTYPITMHFDDFNLTVETREIGDEEYMEWFTKYFSVELGENAVVGTIGAEVLMQHAVTFDLPSGFIEVAPLGTGGSLTPEPLREEANGVVDAPLSLKSGLLWCPVRLDGGDPVALAIGCARYDTLVDRIFMEQRGTPAGNVGPMRMGSIDFAKYVAGRPEELALVSDDPPLGVIGINLLEHFRVRVDPGTMRTTWLPAVAPDFPEEDLAFFIARLEEDADATEAWLDTYPDVRLSHEAAELLLEQRFDEMARDEDTQRAVAWIGKTAWADLKTTVMLDLMKDLQDEERWGEILIAGAYGVEGGRKDRYPNAVHEVHGRMGRIHMDRGDSKPALRHLLSAAFGLPEDGRINLDLGRYYEAEGRHKRAFSRYLQAMIHTEVGPEAIEGLARVESHLDLEEPFSVDLVERLIAGKVRNFGAPTVFEPDDEHPAGKTALCEFFTNGYLGDERGGAIGGALGNEGLVTHFDPEHCVFLSHHLPAPRLDPLCTEFGARRAKELGVAQPTMHMVDGRVGGPGAAKWREAEAVYLQVRELVLEAIQATANYELELEATLDAGQLNGSLTVYGPEEARAQLRIVLAERGVLFPGGSTVVIHRYLARHELTDIGGVEYVPEPDPDGDGMQTVTFSANLETIAQTQLDYLTQLEKGGLGATTRLSTRVDPAQAVIVAWIENPRSRQVYQAIVIDPDRPDVKDDLLPTVAEEAR